MGAVRDAFDAIDPHLVVVLALFGLLTAIPVVLRALNNIYKTFLRPGKNLKKLGKWAVVTGATDGIGKAYAIALAKKGLNVLLISRTESKLVDVAKEIAEATKGAAETKYLVIDYSKFDQAARDKVNAAVKDLDIGVLINSVGVSYRYPLYFHELTNEEVANLMEMNVNSTTWMTKMVIGGMIERKRGAILNISSGSAMFTLPLLAEYSAAKSYIEKFSRALNAEYASTKNVTVQCQIPFYVATKLAKMRKSFSVPTPKEFASMGIKWIGYADPVVSPFWFHALQGYIMDCAPVPVITKVITDMHLATRKRGQKKDAAKKAEGKTN